MCCRLDGVLSDLEARLESVDEPTRQILQNSTHIWLGNEPDGQSEGQAGENGPIGRQLQSEPENGKHQ